MSEFCKSLGISRHSFCNVRAGFLAQGNTVLNPRSRAPKRPARVYEHDTADVVLAIRERLAPELHRLEAHFQTFTVTA